MFPLAQLMSEYYVVVVFINTRNTQIFNKIHLFIGELFNYIAKDRQAHTDGPTTS